VDDRQRAERILDAAAELVLRWGYKRVTVEEIAKRAGVGKGTVYLHFATRESLFVRVLMRESLRLVDGLLAAMRGDPAAVLPGEQARLTYLWVADSPLLSAMFSRDLDVLGDLAGDASAAPLRVLKADLADELLRLLRAHRLVRDDVEPAVQRYTLNAVQTGFYLSAPLGGVTLGPKALAEALGNAVAAVAHTDRCAEPALLAEAVPSVIALYERFRAAMAAAVASGPDKAGEPLRGWRWDRAGLADRAPGTDDEAALLAWLAGMREEHPVWRDRYGTWHVFRHHDVEVILRDPTTFSSDTARLVPSAAPLRPGMLTQIDPPEHRALRRVVSSAFSPHQVASVEPRIREITNRLLEAVGERFDLVDALAFPLPVIVIAEMLGLPTTDRPRFRSWAEGLFAMQVDDPADPELGPRVVSAVAEMKSTRKEVR